MTGNARKDANYKPANPAPRAFSCIISRVFADLYEFKFTLVIQFHAIGKAMVGIIDDMKVSRDKGVNGLIKFLF